MENARQNIMPEIDPAPVSSTTKAYVVRECFHSLQGEGARAGSVNVFLRFAYCNLQCTVAKEGFNCDTDFSHGDRLSLEEVVALVKKTDETPGGCDWIILTGGEPTLQFDSMLGRALWAAGYDLAIETNGTHKLKGTVEYIAVSPKPGSPCVLQHADECRIVLKAEQVPDEGQMEMAKRSERLFISPAFLAPPVEGIIGFEAGPPDMIDTNLEWCIDYVKKNPQFSLSIQTHKILGLR